MICSWLKLGLAKLYLLSICYHNLFPFPSACYSENNTGHGFRIQVCILLLSVGNSDPSSREYTAVKRVRIYHCLINCTFSIIKPNKIRTTDFHYQGLYLTIGVWLSKVNSTSFTMTGLTSSELKELLKIICSLKFTSLFLFWDIHVKILRGLMGCQVFENNIFSI